MRRVTFTLIYCQEAHSTPGHFSAKNYCYKFMATLIKLLHTPGAQIGNRNGPL